MQWSFWITGDNKLLSNPQESRHMQMQKQWQLLPGRVQRLMQLYKGEPESLDNGALYILLHMIPHPCVAAGIQDYFTTIKPIHVPVFQAM